MAKRGIENMNAESFANELFPFVWDYFKIDSKVRPQRTTKPSIFFTKPKTPESDTEPDPIPSTSSATSSAQEPRPSTSSATSSAQEPMPSTSSATSSAQEPMPSTSSATSSAQDPMPSTSSGTSSARDPMPSTSSAEPEQQVTEEIPKVIKAILGMQICFRSDLKVVFDGIPSLKIEEPSFMQFVFNYLETFELDKDIFERTLGSCVIYAEFALYKYQKKEENYFELVPSLWCKYFEMHLKNNGFEKSGSWEALRQAALLMRGSLSVVDETLIENFLNPYDTVESLEDIKKLIPGLRERLDGFVAKYNSISV